ncbi:MAG: hypothetical protein NC489_08605 [Ruminococcus flavefaciens]|nr:hypothetical protein [Ruminococcus flavefaciens]
MNSIINWDLITLDELSSKRYGLFGMYAISNRLARHQVLFPYLEKCFLFGTPDGRKELKIILKKTEDAKKAYAEVQYDFAIRFAGILLPNGCSGVANSNNYIFNGIFESDEWDELTDEFGFIGYPKFHYDLIDPAIAGSIVKSALI